MSDTPEYFEVVDSRGKVIRLATREECHSDPTLLHRVVHVLVFDPLSRLFLQKRGKDKDIQPDKWDTSVGGHLCPGESLEVGASREMGEELGIQGVLPVFLYHYIMYSSQETEWVHTYQVVWDGPIRLEPGEIQEGRFWRLEEIEAHLGKQVFTPNFEDEFKRWKDYKEGKR